MKKGAIVIATTNQGKRFVTEILKVIKDKAVVTAAWNSDIEEVISDDVKELLEIEEEYDVALLPLTSLELVLGADTATLIHTNNEITLDVPGFVIKFVKKDHLDMWEEFANKYFPKFEVMCFNPEKMEVYYPTVWMKEIPTMLEKRMAVTAFKNSLNLKNVPMVVDELIEIQIPEIEVLEIENVRYIRKELK